MLRAILIVLRNFVLYYLSPFTLKPKRSVHYIAETLFNYKIFAKKRKLEQKDVFKVLPSKDTETINLTNLTGNTYFTLGGSYAVDIVSLCFICQLLKPKVIFEIGTFRGYISKHFSENTDEDAKIYTLDLPPDETDVKLKTTSIDSKNIQKKKQPFSYPKVETLFGDSATFNFSPFYNEVDFFFIDGAHSYEYVKSDTENALKCTHKGSVIAWHDYGRMGLNGVTKYLEELSKEYKIYSVPAGSLAFMVVE